MNDEEDEIALKMRKKELRRVEKEKAAAQKKAAAERQRVEHRRFVKEMNREDPNFEAMAAKLPEAERSANEAEFLALFAKLEAERAAAAKAAEDKKELQRLQLIPNPSRDWKCSGCARVNILSAEVIAQQKARIKREEKRKREQREAEAKWRAAAAGNGGGGGGDDDDSDEDSLDDEETAAKKAAAAAVAAAAAAAEELPEPPFRCSFCGVPHTYMPRGKRGAMVMNSLVLKEVFEELDGDNWSRKKGWLFANRLSDWHGVTADDDEEEAKARKVTASGVVLKLELVDNGLKGEFPLRLCHLVHLTHLLCDSNDIIGELPEALASLVNLKFLSMCGCKLVGTIPRGICTNLPDLRTLALAGNQLSGAIPDEINKLENLRSLWLQDNKMCGEIPSVANLDELRQMDISNNAFGGNLPFDIAGCRELTRFNASSNMISGPIPSPFGRLRKLQALVLNDNHLSGPFPAKVLTALRSLSEFHAQNNRIAGCLPTEGYAEGCPELSELCVQNNRLTGPIPASLSELTDLTVLDLSNNRLGGHVPIKLKKLINLTYIDVTGNRGLERYSLAECRIALDKRLPHCVKKI